MNSYRALANVVSRERERRSRFQGVLAVLIGVALFATWNPGESRAQATDPFLGQLALVSFNFAPHGWALCNGQILPINQNQALFSLLGTTYGGDGITTFALPDLRGRVPISSGQGPGLQNYPIGQTGGQELVTLTLSQIPAHTHAAMCDTTVASTDAPAGMIPARNAGGVPQYGTNATTSMSSSAIGSAGGGQAHENRQPYITLNWIIALQGVYPTQ